MSNFIKISLFVLLLMLSHQLQAADSAMEIGTNFWARVDWTGERPFKSDVDFRKAWNSGMTEDSLVAENVWNETFLQEIDFYTVLRFMDWVPTNKSSVVNWSQRTLPTSQDQTARFKDEPGVAIEWMIDLCNRVGADMWFCMPHAANDDYHKQLATLVHNHLKPSLKIYVEYSNEVWNFSVQKNYASEQGQKLGISTQEYVGHRSAQMWQTFKDVFGDQFEERVVKVISGQSTNSWIAREQLKYLYSDENPTGLLPDAYGIAPYFGGNGFDADVDNPFEVLETDIFEHRWNKPNRSGRIDNVSTHYNLLQGYDENLKLICYEGGQHITNNATLVNYDPRMYDLYLRYLEALDDYVAEFAHYTHCGTCGDGGCWGAKKYTGQPADEAPKYRALLDYANGIRTDVSGSDVRKGTTPSNYKLQNYPNPFNGSTTIKLTLNQPAFVDLDIYNLAGRKVRQLMQKNMDAGSHLVHWDAVDDQNEPVSSGVYMVRLDNIDDTVIRKLLLIK